MRRKKRSGRRRKDSKESISSDSVEEVLSSRASNTKLREEQRTSINSRSQCFRPNLRRSSLWVNLSPWRRTSLWVTREAVTQTGPCWVLVQMPWTPSGTSLTHEHFLVWTNDKLWDDSNKREQQRAGERERGMKIIVCRQRSLYIVWILTNMSFEWCRHINNQIKSGYNFGTLIFFYFRFSIFKIRPLTQY